MPRGRRTRVPRSLCIGGKREYNLKKEKKEKRIYGEMFDVSFALG